ncbi:MAG: NAD-dependent succinate-semialdehyde dehydrogenase [Oceanicaulis sp.]
MSTITVTNPATGEAIATYERHGEADVDAALERAFAGFQTLWAAGYDSRAARLVKAAGILEAEKEDHARLMVSEMGKPITQARAEIDKCAAACRFYAENGEAFLADEALDAPEKGRCFIRRVPIGPVFAVMPWNFPFWQVFRFAAPNLMAGNPGILKHSSNTPGSALAIEDVLKRAGFEDGAFQTLLIGSELSSKVIADERVRGVTLTGSEGAGSKVAEQAGKAILPSVMELGGSDPFIVMPSADLDEAAKIGVKARVQNNGQSCIAAKRFIVHEQVYEAYREKFVAHMKALKVGDPMEDDTDIGPLADLAAADTLMDQVAATADGGADSPLPPKRLEGAFVRPGVMEAIPKGTPGYEDEMFGPVALFFSARDLDAAIGVANDHRYGLGASFWSRDEGEIDAAVTRISAGSTYVNQMVASDPRLPFGGAKKSGYGRELARDGIVAFTNPKTIAITGV